MLTILFGLASAVGWGAPDAVLAQAVRRVGAFPVVFGSIVIGTVLASPLALVLDLPDWSERSLLLAPLVGVLTVVGFQAGFMSFREGAVSVVAPIIACEGGVAALFSIAGGEHLNGLVLAGLPFAVAGVVLVSRGEGESSRAGVLPAVAAALIWGGVLALSAPIAHDLGAGWAFLLVRGSAVVAMLPVALARGRAARCTGRVVARGDLGRLRRRRLLRVRARGRPRAGCGGRGPGSPVRHRRGDRGRDLLRRAPAQAPGRGDRRRGVRRRRHGRGQRVTQSRAMTRFHELPDGARLAYDDTGEGRPVVLLHGVCMSRRFFERNAGPLAERFRIVNVDLRGPR